MSGTIDPQAEATIDKIRAEAEKLRAEAREAARPPLTRPAIWIPLLLAIGSGAGGLLTAYFTWQTKTADFEAARLDADRKKFKLEQETDQLEVRRNNLALAIDAMEQRRRDIEGKVAVAAQNLADLQRALAAQASTQTPAQTAAVERNLSGARDALGSAVALLASSNVTVFLQFRGDVSRDVMRGLQANLAEAGFRAPGIERVAGDYANEVRYFHAEDRDAAQAIVTRVQAFFGAGCRLRSPVKDVLSRLAAPRGQIEVWIGATEGDCRG